MPLARADVRPRPAGDRRRDHAADPGRPDQHAAQPERPDLRLGRPRRRSATRSARPPTRIGHPIYLVSDEPYNRIVFDGRTFHSPAQAYAHTIVTYSYGKTLLAPGMRIGYLTVPPTMPERAELRDRFLLAQVASGYSFPNADLQHAIEDLEELSIDIGALERRRDRMGAILDELGYEHTMPEGTFYILARSPIADDRRFAEILAEEGAVVLPGAVVEVPGWFRISLTASDAMVEASVAAFDRARDRAIAEAPEPAPA